MELGLSRGVGRKRVGLGGGRPGFWLWGGLLLFVHEQSEGVGLSGLVVKAEEV